MAYNPNWPRWVQASVSHYLKTAANAQGYASLVEGLEERETEFLENKNRLEIRMTGPNISEWSKNYYHFEVDVNILIFSYMGGQLPNAYSGTEMAGYMAEAVSKPIPVYKYGEGVEDDQSLIGCLIPRADNREEVVRVAHFGEIDRVHRLRQYGVDVNLSMEICL